MADTNLSSWESLFKITEFLLEVNGNILIFSFKVL